MTDSRDAESLEPGGDWAGDRPGDAPWPLRPVLLAALGLAAALAVHFILGEFAPPTLTAWQLSLAAAVTVGAGLTGFTLERRHWWASLIFALSMAGVAAAVIWWNGTPSGWSAAEGWRVVSLFLAIAIAAPLFQAGRDAGGARLRYAWVHDHAWTNVVLWGACWVFVAIVWALAWLLAALFDLIKIDFLRELLMKDWFARALVGLAFGAALGLLRELDAIVRTLRRVVTTVLSVLAPVLGAGLLVFLLALPFTGLGALWEATSAATPVLLACVVGALVLANSVIGNSREEERRFALLRFAAMALALVVLPLAVIAAISTGLRIGQYGFTPERLWAATFVGIACVCGLAYLAALLLGRMEWAAKARRANLGLALFVYAVALVLATPLISFNAISTRDQVARLESGRVSPDQFDWRALAFDFGEPGRVALRRYQASANPAIKALADQAARAANRWDVPEASRLAEGRARVAANLRRVLPGGTALPDGLRDAIAAGYNCSGNGKCTILMVSGSEALLFDDACLQRHRGATGQTRVTLYCLNPTRYYVRDGRWAPFDSDSPEMLDEATRARLGAAFDAGQVEVRTVERRQAFVGGRPVGEPFE